MDIRIWDVLECEAWRTLYRNIEHLERSLAAASVQQDVSRAAIAELPDRFEGRVKAKGGHFERCLRFCMHRLVSYN